MADMFEDKQVQPWIDSLKELIRNGHKNYKNLLEMEQDILQIGHFLEDFSNLKYALDVSAIVAATDTNGKIIYANDKFCELSKFSRKELIGNDHRILNSGHHDKQFFGEMWNQIRQGEVWEGEVKNKAKDGSYYWVKTTIVPLKDLTGNTIMYIAIRTDISEGKNAQEKLITALQNDYRHVVTSMQNLIFKVVKDKNGQFVYTLNEGKLAYELGLEKEKMLNKSPKDIFSEELQLMLEKYYCEAFLGRQVSYNYSFRGRQLLTYLSPIISNGKVVEVIGCMSDITELHEAKQEVEFLAYHDSLTSLPNRRKLNEDLNHIIEEFLITNDRFALFYIDLDRFKHINDSFGHSVGDCLITKVSSLFKKAICENSRLYRFAGDEFIIIFPQIKNHEEAMMKAKQILLLLEQSINLPNQLEINATCSIGISLFPEHGETSEELIRNADAAMYTAKTYGRSTYKIYEEEICQSQEKALLIEYHLRKAIDQHEFELYFQPKIDLITKEMNGMEALLRWNNEEIGSIPPDTFIPIAEETGLILKIDRWVLEKACEQNKKWNDTQFSKPMKVSVNISPLHFRTPNFQHVVQQVLEQTGLDPNLLEIEITENSFINQTEECIECLNELRKMGITVAIDDFGKGYSSLNYLRKFPIHALKIDRTFIHEVSRNMDDIAIVKAITLLAHELNLKVVAEGIETKEVINVLEEIGCDEIQGFYVSKPLPKNEFENLIKQKTNQSFLI
ncbi:EAL domain-containing protein [Bacillus sp. FJAT-49705]|uniref:EAL domain-containing protein n=1 Tax=Cytobacillus citreus TaxID=2833586 RepID=A0ABS5NYN8_9BACI|nr:EAL domain-containing protein [Cytobacillus citreus]MBS4192971.1 EAL domain-containing protein [Cytobacillus citreus]